MGRIPGSRKFPVGMVIQRITTGTTAGITASARDAPPRRPRVTPSPPRMIRPLPSRHGLSRCPRCWRWAWMPRWRLIGWRCARPNGRRGADGAGRHGGGAHKAGISVAQAVRIYCRARGWQGFRASWDWRRPSRRGGRLSIAAGSSRARRSTRQRGRTDCRTFRTWIFLKGKQMKVSDIRSLSPCWQRFSDYDRPRMSDEKALVYFDLLQEFTRWRRCAPVSVTRCATRSSGQFMPKAAGDAPGAAG